MKRAFKPFGGPSRRRIKIEGQTFGKLEVLSYRGVWAGVSEYDVRCSCGLEFVARGVDLRRAGGLEACRVCKPVVRGRKKVA